MRTQKKESTFGRARDDGHILSLMNDIQHFLHSSAYQVRRLREGWGAGRERDRFRDEKAKAKAEAEVGS